MSDLDCPYCGCDPCELEEEREWIKRLSHVRPVSPDARERRDATLARAREALHRLEELHTPSKETEWMRSSNG